MPPRVRLAVLVLVSTLSAAATGTLAVAQTKKPATKPKPPAAKVDAGGATSEEPGGTSTSAPASATTGAADGGASAAHGAVEPPPVSEMMDGGLRASPLNPAPQELAGNANVDAGTPLDYDRLLADIAALRARVAALSDNLYQSRIGVALQTDGDHGKIVRLAVSLDDGVVWTAPGQVFSSSDMSTVYEHSVAPGRHAVTIDVDRKDDREESFRTSQRSRFMVDVPRDHRVDVQVKIVDDSSMGGDFPSDRSGRYDLRFRVKAVAKPVGK